MVSWRHRVADGRTAGSRLMPAQVAVEREFRERALVFSDSERRRKSQKPSGPFRRTPGLAVYVRVV